MTWNILAPIWVDKASLAEAGIVNINLLNEKVRLWAIVQEIKKKKPDILALQEVQEDVFNELRQLLNRHYADVGLARNENNYWESFLSNGTKYKANGVATFYNKHKFTAERGDAFRTSDSGSVAQLAVLRPKHRHNHAPKPIIALNCHLETGFTIADVTKRVSQGSIVIDQATSISREYANEDPTVLIIGDMNSMHPYNGFTNFEDHGYVDAQRKVGEKADATYFFEPPFQTPGGELMHGGAIDHVFVRGIDIEYDRVRLQSVTIPSVASDEFSEKEYVIDAIKLLRTEFRSEEVKGTKKMITHLLTSDVFSSIFNAVHVAEKKEYNINRALRRGSDHLNMMVGLQIRDGRQ